MILKLLSLLAYNFVRVLFHSSAVSIEPPPLPHTTFISNFVDVIKLNSLFVLHFQIKNLVKLAFLGPGTNVIKLFTAVSYEFLQ
jgi:hypothetical protein